MRKFSGCVIAFILASLCHNAGSAGITLFGKGKKRDIDVGKDNGIEGLRLPIKTIPSLLPDLKTGESTLKPHQDNAKNNNKPEEPSGLSGEKRLITSKPKPNDSTDKAGKTSKTLFKGKLQASNQEEKGNDKSTHQNDENESEKHTDHEEEKNQKITPNEESKKKLSIPVGSQDIPEKPYSAEKVHVNVHPFPAVESKEKNQRTKDLEVNVEEQPNFESKTKDPSDKKPGKEKVENAKVDEFKSSKDEENTKRDDIKVVNEKPAHIVQNDNNKDPKVLIEINGFQDQENSHFFIYFSSIIILCILGYLVFHNKKKIIGLIVEGRQGGRPRRRSGSKGYRKLETVEDVITEIKPPSSSTNIIY